MGCRRSRRSKGKKEYTDVEERVGRRALIFLYFKGFQPFQGYEWHMI
jgi:hypothetical protein